jgi:hypothetical protein
VGASSQHTSNKRLRPTWVREAQYTNLLMASSSAPSRILYTLLRWVAGSYRIRSAMYLQQEQNGCRRQRVPWDTDFFFACASLQVHHGLPESATSVGGVTTTTGAAPVRTRHWKTYTVSPKVKKSWDWGSEVAPHSHSIWSTKSHLGERRDNKGDTLCSCEAYGMRPMHKGGGGGEAPR